MSNSTAAITSSSSFSFSDTSTFITSSSSFAPTSSSTSITPATSVLTIATLPDTSSVVIVSSVVTQSATSNGSLEPTTVIITSTAPNTPPATTTPTSSSSSSTSSSSSSTAAFASNTSSAQKSSGGGGLSSGGKVAIAVVVPVVAVAVLALAGLWFWRRRKQRKSAEEMRKKEIEEYGFNPNNDPTLPAVGSDGVTEMHEDGAGYRGWGATSSNPTGRQPSTNLSSGRGVGLAVSDEGSTGHGQPGSPTQQHSEGYSNDPLVGSPHEGRPASGDSETIGALPPMAAGGRQNTGVNRGPSNASSAYSAGDHSDHSGDAPIPVGNTASGQYYADEPYYNESAQPQHGPYGDGTYGGGQPVIRDTNARRNTRIEKPSVYPPQGNSGVATNF